MKLINLAILTLSLLILSNAQPTEENPSSEDSSSPSDDDTPSEGQTEESTENPESSSSSDDDQEDGAHQSGEPAEGGESTPQSGDDQNHQEGQNQDSKNGNPEEQPAAAAAGATKGSYQETYNEIGKILDAVDFKSIEDLHLQRMLENNFQGRLRNPIRSQTGQIADFSAIQSCFGSLGGDVQKLIDDAKKQFETCKTGDDGADSAVCTDQQENKFADGVIAVATTLQGCIASQRKD